ncbi:predicted protein [Lichtheimia corymbifera JMRC:FSU:9682]|uniref:RING-type domain-containing protein n=1 Tax=Lichtheimia corymbifera JMRC:FSU:9682 TaxID=1263082 RepID=A0A068RNA2_9FUNG|nr:predicted protein [Lichtheimia corymbifera JMRC:FSU:9682]
MVTEHVPSPPKEGLQGVLYDRGNSCDDHPQDALPIRIQSNVPKIALIKRGECYFTQKLLNAQKDGASAAIVYDNATFDQDPSSSTGMFVQPDMVKIPAFYVDLSVGLEMYKRLENVSQSMSSDNGSLPLTRVTIYPPQGAKLDPWQFALIIIGLVVVTSLAILVAMQCHLWRVGRRGDNLNSSFGRERMDDEESIPPEDQLWRSLAMVSPHTHPRQKRQLTQDMVRMLPTRLYGLENQEECEKAAKEQNGCVICLEPFKFGDAIRSLPCLHEYHKDCIDPWLTKKSASCPLCLQVVNIPAPPEEAHIDATPSPFDVVNHHQHQQNTASPMNESIEMTEQRSITNSTTDNLTDIRRLWQ